VGETPLSNIFIIVLLQGADGWLRKHIEKIKLLLIIESFIDGIGHYCI
jgi:hypothetical protein